jgi:hypothetical protein
MVQPQAAPQTKLVKRPESQTRLAVYLIARRADWPQLLVALGSPIQDRRLKSVLACH